MGYCSAIFTVLSLLPPSITMTSKASAGYRCARMDLRHSPIVFWLLYDATMIETLGVGLAILLSPKTRQHNREENLGAIPEWIDTAVSVCPLLETDGNFCHSKTCLCSFDEHFRLYLVFTGV